MLQQIQIYLADKYIYIGENIYNVNGIQLAKGPIRTKCMHGFYFTVVGNVYVCHGSTGSFLTYKIYFELFDNFFVIFIYTETFIVYFYDWIWSQF